MPESNMHHIRFHPDDWQALEEIAAREGMTTTAFIHMACAQQLATRRRKWHGLRPRKINKSKGVTT